MTNPRNTVLYTGVTNDLMRRVQEHKDKKVKGFSSKYNTNKLVYYQETTEVLSAIEEEKRIKAGSRVKKIALIEEINPEWKDLSSEWE